MKKLDFLNQYKALAKEMGVSWARPDVAYAQAVLESGNFDSRIYRAYHNMFGMRNPNKRQTTSLGASNTPEKQAKYSSDADSIRDHLLYLKQWSPERFKIHSDHPYLYMESFQNHERPYAADQDYLTKLRIIYSNNFNNDVMNFDVNTIQSEIKKLPSWIKYSVIGIGIVFLIKKLS